MSRFYPTSTDQPDPAPGQRWRCTTASHHIEATVYRVGPTHVVMARVGNAGHHRKDNRFAVPLAGFKTHNLYLRGAK